MEHIFFILIMKKCGNILINSVILIVLQIAEFFVLLVQYIALKNEVAYFFKKIHYGCIILGIFIGTVASLWVKTLGLGYFGTLLMSAILFFCAYFLFLLYKKEELVVDIWIMIITKIKNLVK